MEREGITGKQLNLEGEDVAFARLASASCCVSAKFGQMSKISVQEKIEASGSRKLLAPDFPIDEMTAEPESASLDRRMKGEEMLIIALLFF